MAARHIIDLLSGKTIENMLSVHPPFQIDGNFGLTAGITEMLLQSHGGFIELLPALPDIWKKGHVKGLRARGGITVDIFWENGKLIQAVLTADQDTCVKVKYKDISKDVSLKKDLFINFLIDKK